MSEPLVLDRPRRVGELLVEALRLWLRHLPVFLAITALVVLPVVLLVDGVLGRQLFEDADFVPSVGASLLSALLQGFVVPPLVTAAHVVAVLELGEGRRPRVGASLARALRRLAPLVAVGFLYGLAVTVGLVLLIIPGVIAAVVWYFAAQAVVVEDRTISGAFGRSGDLVADRFGYTFGVLAIAFVATTAFVYALGYGLGLVAGLADSGAIVVLAVALAQTIALSLTALVGTLLFFSLRAQTDVRPATPMTAPESPIASADR